MQLRRAEGYNAVMQHLVARMERARSIIDAVNGVDLRPLLRQMSDATTYPYHPAMLVALLFYGYTNGTFAGCELERATYEDPAFRYIASDAHPSCAVIASFRQRYLPELLDAFLHLRVREARASRSELRRMVAQWFLSAERAKCEATCPERNVAFASAQ
ncbi:MAG: transposase [Vulcanimicrobiaceae bacterium]